MTNWISWLWKENPGKIKKSSWYLMHIFHAVSYVWKERLHHANSTTKESALWRKGTRMQGRKCTWCQLSIIISFVIPPQALDDMILVTQTRSCYAPKCIQGEQKKGHKQLFDSSRTVRGSTGLSANEQQPGCLKGRIVCKPLLSCHCKTPDYNTLWTKRHKRTERTPQRRDSFHCREHIMCGRMQITGCWTQRVTYTVTGEGVWVRVREHTATITERSERGTHTNKSRIWLARSLF